MFIWSNKFETKLDLVDTQHKNLFDLLNKLCVNIKNGIKSEGELDSAIRLLIHYTKTHLHDEELLMQDSRIDNRFFTRHRMEHNSFLYDVDRFSEFSSSDDGSTDKADKIVRFIAFWLIFHILGTDLAMAEQIACIKSGMTPQQAFETVKEQKLDSVTVKMMLDAVMNLWMDSKNAHANLEKKYKGLEIKCKNLEEKCTDLESKIQTVLVETIDYESDFRPFDLYK